MFCSQWILLSDAAIINAHLHMDVLFGQGQLLLLMRYQLFKNLLHFNDGLEVKQLQPLTAKCHKLPLFCFDDFSPSSKSMKAYKKTLKVVLVRSEDRNMKRLAPLIQAISYLFSFAILYWQLFVKYMKILYEFFVIIFRHQVA